MGALQGAIDSVAQQLASSPLSSLGKGQLVPPNLDNTPKTYAAYLLNKNIIESLGTTSLTDSTAVPNLQESVAAVSAAQCPSDQTESADIPGLSPASPPDNSQSPGDFDHQSVCSSKDMQWLTTTVRGYRAQGVLHSDNWRQIFRCIDSDQSGHLSPTEFVAGLRRLGIPDTDLSDPAAKAIFALLDINNNNLLSDTEFRDWLDPRPQSNVFKSSTSKETKEAYMTAQLQNLQVIIRVIC